MSETKTVRLDKPFTWMGINYGAGVNDLPAKGADYAVKRKFGALLGEGEEVGAEDAPADFTPLPLKDTIEKFFKDFDFSDTVVNSLRAHRETIVEANNTGKSLGDLMLDDSKADQNGKTDKTDRSGENAGGNSEKESEKQSEKEPEKQVAAAGLPADFPMRHVFDKAGFKSVADVQSMTREELIAIDNIVEKTADKALAYGK